MDIRLHSAPLAELEPITLYRILQLRTDVFVVEQHCPYPELDGRDAEPATVHVWAGDGDDTSHVAATLRILRDEEALRIGRVAAHPDHRGSGLAAKLFEFALARCAELEPGLPIVLDAQAPLEAWYGRFGFERSGETFLEDGIPHVPMIRPAAPAR